ncbi:hypothetical protein E2C01_006649 [Portunus trituberculatus]|uniref:Uncharacterized protein n=1 Tax=Portunus trituberculatus TaxID=210409 RepID=A0A5B7CWX4_PORTR|nr:hypothetical protein [Portunus trituberculatus]
MPRNKATEQQQELLGHYLQKKIICAWQQQEDQLKGTGLYSNVFCYNMKSLATPHQSPPRTSFTLHVLVFPARQPPGR